MKKQEKDFFKFEKLRKVVKTKENEWEQIK